MRYRDTGDYQNPVTPIGDDLVFFSVVLGVLMGIGFIGFGLRVKRFWMVIWGIGLVVASMSYFVMQMLGY